MLFKDALKAGKPEGISTRSIACEVPSGGNGMCVSSSFTWCLFACFLSHTVFMPHCFSFLLSFVYLFLELLYYFHYYLLLRVI